MSVLGEPAVEQILLNGRTRNNDPILQPRLVLARHGQDFPLRVARTDSWLTALGRAQAQTLANAVAGLHLEKLYASPRRRARETAAIAGAQLGLQTIIDARLSPVPHGIASLSALQRVIYFCRQLDDEPAFIITHGGTLRVFLFVLTGMRRVQWLWYPIPYCQPFVMR